ncbi:hypothetical protein BsWGS_27039 [Bradybaena similaris]
MDVGHSKLRTLSCILGCTLSYLFLVVVVETLVFYERSLKMLLLLDTGCFIVWSLCLGITFICSGFRLTQHIIENSKELHDSNNHQYPANNSENVKLPSSITNETSITIFSVDLNSSTLEPDTLASANADASCVLISEAAVSSASHTSSNRITEQYDPCMAVSHTRPELLKRSPVIIALAEDDDDKSTSSTDIERPRKESMSIRKRTKRRIKHRKGLIKSRSEAKSTTVPSKYRAVSATEDKCTGKDSSPASRKKFKVNHSNPNKTSNCTCSKLDKASDDKYNIDNKEADSSAAHALLRKPLQETSETTYITSSELPLLASAYLHPEKIVSSHRNSENGNSGEDCDTGLGENICKHIPAVTCECNSLSVGTCLSEENRHHFHVSEAGLSLVSSNKDLNITDRRSQLINDDLHEEITSIECNPCPTLTDSEQMKENGYLADAENVISTHSSRLESRPVLLRSRHLSFQRSSASYSDEDSLTSTSERRRSSTSISVEHIPAKQDRLVQAAVYLTYVLTLLFLFACLLQLYTAFGVYGVLGTIPRPDPWPWLIFQSIFR